MTEIKKSKHFDLPTTMLKVISGVLVIAILGGLILTKINRDHREHDEELNQKLTLHFKDESLIVVEHLITDVVISCNQITDNLELSFVHLDNKVTKPLDIDEATYLSFCAENSRIKFKNDVEYGEIKYFYDGNERRGVAAARLHRYGLAVTIVSNALSVVIEDAKEEVAARMTWESNAKQ